MAASPGRRCGRSARVQILTQTKCDAAVDRSVCQNRNVNTVYALVAWRRTGLTLRKISFLSVEHHCTLHINYIFRPTFSRSSNTPKTSARTRTKNFNFAHRVLSSPRGRLFGFSPGPQWRRANNQSGTGARGRPPAVVGEPPPPRRCRRRRRVSSHVRTRGCKHTPARLFLNIA